MKEFLESNGGKDSDLTIKRMLDENNPLIDLERVSFPSRMRALDSPLSFSAPEHL